MPRTPRQVAEQVRKMVAGEGVVFADLFAATACSPTRLPCPASLRNCRT